MPDDIPVTIIASYKISPYLNEKSMEIKKNLFKQWTVGKPNIELISTVKSGHYIYQEEPTLVISELKKFIVNVQNQ